MSMLFGRTGRRPGIASAFVVAISAFAAASPAADLPASVSIGTHRVGLSYNSVGVGVAKVVNEKSPIKMFVKPFAGPNAWMPLLDSGELELGVLSSMDAGWAYLGGPGYKRKHANVRILMRGNSIETLVITRASSNIRTMKDVKGRSLTSHFGGNIVARNILEVYLASAGLGWNDVKNVPVPDVASSMRSLQEGRVEVAFGGAPDTGRELDAAIGLRALSIADAKAATARAEQILPGARPVPIKKGKGWLKEDVNGLGYSIYLAASAKLSDAGAYEIVKTLWAHYKELQAIHPWLRGWSPETMFNPDSPAPLHDGAIRFYREKGLWSATAEANQKKLIGAAK